VLKPADTERLLEIGEELETLEAERQLYAQTQQLARPAPPSSSVSPSCSAGLLMQVAEAARRGQGAREQGVAGALSYLVTAVLREKTRRVARMNMYQYE
jgi:hypothetical protein